MKKFYFSFGLSTPYGDRYVIINAPDCNTARNVMMRAHGSRWCTSYTEEQFKKTKMFDRCTLLAELVSE